MVIPQCGLFLSFCTTWVIPLFLHNVGYSLPATPGGYSLPATPVGYSSCASTWVVPPVHQRGLFSRHTPVGHSPVIHPWVFSLLPSVGYSSSCQWWVIPSCPGWLFPLCTVGYSLLCTVGLFLLCTVGLFLPAHCGYSPYCSLVGYSPSCSLLGYSCSRMLHNGEPTARCWSDTHVPAPWSLIMLIMLDSCDVRSAIIY